jgi:4-hydroxyacetophenone monooxygenase
VDKKMLVEAEDDDALTRSLEGSDIVILLMSLVQLTGDESLLDKVLPFVAGPFDYMTSVPPHLQAEIRTRLKQAMRRIADGRAVAVPSPPEALLRKMMRVCVGEDLPDEYIPMMREDMRFDERNPASVPQAAPLSAEGFRVVVVGAGMSGLCTAIKLKEAGIAFTVFEKNRTVGGTWFENAYPGCGVDTANHFYSYSFEPNHDWPHYFSKRDELYAYFERCADKYDVRKDIRFNTEVTSAHYDEARARWAVSVRSADRSVETVEANVVIFAVGQLNRPCTPDIPGLAAFAGPVVHTARWQADIDVTGKRVAMIGTGASGMQVGPTVAPSVKHLTIFQRSPHWAASNPNYHRSVSDAKKWALKHIPYYALWYRFQLFWGSADAVHRTLHVDPQWPHQDRSLNQTNEQTRLRLIEHIRMEVGDDPELMQKAVPQYPPYGKRMLRDNHWYRMLTRDNVELVTERIKQVRAGDIVTESGKAYPADLIVLATGFRAGQLLDHVDVRGRGGRLLREDWAEDNPRAYLGITVSGYPNLFLLYGPGTNLAHGGSAIFHTECQLRYIFAGLHHLIETGAASMECRPDVQDAYIGRVDQAHSRMVWAHKGVTSWYKNKQGRVFATTPWRMIDYWRWTGAFDPADYVWN